jgi:DNA-binding NarL/FixJ family response regulator
MAIRTVKLYGVVYQCPYAHLIRPLSVVEANRLRESIVRNNGILSPIAFDQHGNVLDGINRLEMMADIGIPLKESDKKVFSIASEEEAREILYDLNTVRRHLSAAELEEIRQQKERDRQERRAQVEQLRVEGKTLREIAGDLGVGKSTVDRDAKSTGRSVPQENVGTDRPVEQTESALGDRRVKVSELRKTGKSQRQIADELDVAKSTVASDLEQIAAPEPVEIKGKDGRTRKNKAAQAAWQRKKTERQEAKKQLAELKAKEKEASGEPSKPIIDSDRQERIKAALDKIAAVVESYTTELPELKPLITTIASLRVKVGIA